MIYKIILDFEVTDEKDVIQQWTHYLKSETVRSLEIDRKETQPALELEMIKPKTTVKKNKVFYLQMNIMNDTSLDFIIINEKWLISNSTNLHILINIVYFFCQMSMIYITI